MSDNRRQRDKVATTCGEGMAEPETATGRVSPRGPPGRSACERGAAGAADRHAGTAVRETRLTTWLGPVVERLDAPV
jgi:hypothetical protein